MLPANFHTFWLRSLHLPLNSQIAQARNCGQKM
jgi:hypothetical protein